LPSEKFEVSNLGLGFYDEVSASKLEPGLGLFSEVTTSTTSLVATDPECWSRLWQDSAFFFGPGTGVKILEKPDPDPE